MEDLDLQEETIFAYNTLNQLVSSIVNGQETAYTYNVDGLRNSKSTNGQVIKHVWNGSHIVLQLDENCEVKATYIRGINLIFSKDHAGNKRYYLYNAHGDVVHLGAENGEIVKSYKYDAFGNELNPDENDGNPFRYSGEYYDQETGTIYLRARYYNPVIGRFITEDTYLGEIDDPLSLNLYTYCSNNPVIFVDPSGHRPIYKEEYNAEIFNNILKDIWNFFDNPSEGRSLTLSSIPVVSTAKDLQETVIPYDMAANRWLTLDEWACVGTALVIPFAGGKHVSEGLQIGARYGDNTVKYLLKSKTSELTSLYRAVGPDEFYEVMETGTFNVLPNGMQAKQFGMSFDETLQFAEKYSDIGAVIEVKVPTNMLDKVGDFTQVDGFLFKNGTITIHSDKLEDFNKIIKQIVHKY